MYRTMNQPENFIAAILVQLVDHIITGFSHHTPDISHQSVHSAQGGIRTLTPFRGLDSESSTVAKITPPGLTSC
jgi:hypothetical protein